MNSYEKRIKMQIKESYEEIRIIKENIERSKLTYENQSELRDAIMWNEIEIKINKEYIEFCKKQIH